MQLIGGQPVDLPEQVPLQYLSRDKLDKISALEVVLREQDRIERPPHARKTALEKALGGGEPMSGKQHLSAEDLSRPDILKAVLLVEGESGRVLERLLRETLGKVAGNKVRACPSPGSGVIRAA